MLWAAGTVVDTKGRAVAGVDVYASVSHIAFRMHHEIRATKTDRMGRWEIRGDGDLMMFGGHLFVYKEGHPPAVMLLGEQGGKNYELVLPSGGGALEVRVFHDGKPLSNAAVRINRSNETPLDSPYIGSRNNGPDREKVIRFASPASKTDATGVARFRQLPPGEYIVTASEGDENAVWSILNRIDYGMETQALSYAICDGVAVRDGETTRFDISIFPQRNRLGVQVLHGTGKPMPTTSPTFSWGRVGDAMSRTNLSFDGEGTGKLAVDRPGLWNVLVRYRENSELESFRDVPFYEASGAVAVSPLLDKRKPVRLTSSHKGPGSVTIHLQDAGGKPIRGFVKIDLRGGGANCRKHRC